MFNYIFILFSSISKLPRKWKNNRQLKLKKSRRGLDHPCLLKLKNVGEEPTL